MKRIVNRFFVTCNRFETAPPLGANFGGGDAVKRFVEDADDALLLGERGERDL